MRGATIPLLPQYAFMAWCSVKTQGQLYLYLLLVLATSMYIVAKVSVTENARCRPSRPNNL